MKWSNGLRESLFLGTFLALEMNSCASEHEMMFMFTLPTLPETTPKSERECEARTTLIVNPQNACRSIPHLRLTFKSSSSRIE